ncbi:unnamed protein product [Dracunculus medinensis]|uniref:Thioredoxin domain-containing protein n=1 Tax=Dracunculus medinensis TaxID=318479 RepID=A0A0N4U3T7_DRAME|nr:unnamed protein product [Dracunculus medinensis]
MSFMNDHYSQHKRFNTSNELAQENYFIGKTEERINIVEEELNQPPDDILSSKSFNQYNLIQTSLIILHKMFNIRSLFVFFVVHTLFAVFQSAMAVRFERKYWNMSLTLLLLCKIILCMCIQWLICVYIHMYGYMRHFDQYSLESRWIKESTNSSLIKRSAPPSKQFFPLHIRDYFNGNDSGDLLNYSEIVIVMFYASWSLECYQMRPVFLEVARSFHNNNDLSFAAINCFAPQGECKKTFKANHFPVIAAFIGKIFLVYRGESGADYLRRNINMIPDHERIIFYTSNLISFVIYCTCCCICNNKWILHIRSSMKRLTNKKEITEFLLEYNCAIFSFYPPETDFQQSSSYKKYLYASLYFSQYDHLLGHVGFALITNPKLARFLNITVGQIRLNSCNYTVDYSFNLNFSAIEITTWILKQNCSSHGLQWISPDPELIVKNHQLQLILKQGPTVMLFTKREVLYPHKSHLSLVEQAAIEYSSCFTGNDLHFRLMAQKREISRRRRSSIIKRDKSYCKNMQTYRSGVITCCLLSKKIILSKCSRYDLLNENPGVCPKLNIVRYN